MGACDRSTRLVRSTTQVDDSGRRLRSTTQVDDVAAKLPQMTNQPMQQRMLMP
jgi:hypothetical protein